MIGQTLTVCQVWRKNCRWSKTGPDSLVPSLFKGKGCFWCVPTELGARNQQFLRVVTPFWYVLGGEVSKDHVPYLNSVPPLKLKQFHLKWLDFSRFRIEEETTKKSLNLISLSLTFFFVSHKSEISVDQAVGQRWTAKKPGKGNPQGFP